LGILDLAISSLQTKIPKFSNLLLDYYFRESSKNCKKQRFFIFRDKYNHKFKSGNTPSLFLPLKGERGGGMKDYLVLDSSLSIYIID